MIRYLFLLPLAIPCMFGIRQWLYVFGFLPELDAGREVFGLLLSTAFVIFSVVIYLNTRETQRTTKREIYKSY